MNELDILLEKDSKLFLKNRQKIDEFLMEVGSICVKLYKDNILTEDFDRLKSKSAQRSDWIYLRNYRNQNCNMDDYGLFYIRYNCSKQYLAYLGVSIGLDIADGVDEREIIYNYLHIGQLLDEYSVTIKCGMNLDSLIEQMELKSNFYKLVEILNYLFSLENSELETGIRDKLQEIDLLLENTIEE